MCGRYVLKREDLEALVNELGLRSLEEFHSRYNIAPSSTVPVVRTRHQTPEVTGLRWGMVPGWAKPDAPVKPLVNVRAESLMGRFCGAQRSRRCILPASGFFEWQAVGSRNLPWYFSARNGTPLALAGIWDVWRDGSGLSLETCAIVTTSSNAVMRPIHDRMPVILTPEQCRVWLGETSPEIIESLLVSPPADALAPRRVGPAVGNVRNDGPECLTSADPAIPDDDSQLSLGL